MIASAAEGDKRQLEVMSRNIITGVGGIHLTLRKPAVFTHSIKPHTGPLQVDTRLSGNTHTHTHSNREAKHEVT